MTRLAVILALLACSSLAAAAPAGAAFVPGIYRIQAMKPFASAPQLYVGVVSSSTSEPARLMAYTADPIQRQKLEWRLDQTTAEFNGRSYTAYILVNRYSHGCLTRMRPLTGNGTRVGQGLYPQTCVRWVLNNGSHWVRFSDAHGRNVGFQLNIPVRPGHVQCLDVTGLSYTAGTHLQVWQCHGGWNQRFPFRNAVGR